MEAEEEPDFENWPDEKLEEYLNKLRAENTLQSAKVRVKTTKPKEETKKREVKMIDL